MATTDPRVDAFIAKAQPFARPILEHLRAVVRGALPEAEETIKWGMPHWTVAGKNVAGMAAFKAHCAFVVHGDGRQGDAMGQYGKIAALSDLPGDTELAAKLHAVRDRVLTKGAAVKRPATRKAKSDIPMPDDLAQALAGTPEARIHFEGFPPSARREYLEWVVEAKRPETRARRIAQAVEWLAEGKKRNWKYEAC